MTTQKYSPVDPAAILSPSDRPFREYLTHCVHDIHISRPCGQCGKSRCMSQIGSPTWMREAADGRWNEIVLDN